MNKWECLNITYVADHIGTLPAKQGLVEVRQLTPSNQH
jgi:hypothetical protein